MADLIRLTENWVTTTMAMDQPLYTALDVSAYDELDLMLITGIDVVAGTALNFVVNIISGTQTMSPFPWIQVATATVTSNSTSTTVAFPRIVGSFYTYVRWSIPTMTGATTARFMIEGVGRSYRTSAVR